MRRLFLVSLLCGALGACASAAETPRQFSGTWDWSFETSAFRTDEGAGPYWLSAEGQTWSQIVAPIESAGAGPWGRLHLVVEADLSAPGRYGHMGAYEREIRVTRVIESELIPASRPPSNN